DDGIFKPDPEWRLIGHVRAIDVTTTDNDGRPYGWGVQIGHTPYPVGYLSPGGVMWAYSLVSATREVPDDAEALRRSLEAAREGYRKEAAAWRARDTRLGAEVDRLEAAVERLRREALKYKEAARKYLSEREKECAEVERWKAEAEMLTAK